MESITELVPLINDGSTDGIRIPVNILYLQFQ